MCYFFDNDSLQVTLASWRLKSSETRLFGQELDHANNKNIKFYIIGIVGEICGSRVDSLHKGIVIWIVCPCHDGFMYHGSLHAPDITSHITVTP